jgi:hypothetical protein
MANTNSTDRSAAELDALYESVLHCRPVIREDEAHRLADLVFDKEHIVREWRLTALLASKGGAFYKELSEDSEKAQALAPAVEPLIGFAKLLRDMANFADCVSARVMTAGCNHDRFVDWMAESE